MSWKTIVAISAVWAAVLVGPALARASFRMPGSNTAPGTALAGDLNQPSGSDGCVEINPSHLGDPCAAAALGEGLGSADLVATYGTNVYVASGGAIEVLQRDPSDSGLTDEQCLDGDGTDEGSNPTCTPETMMVETESQSIRVSPNGKWVYVSVEDRGESSISSNELVVFQRNASTGELSQVQCLTSDGSDGAEPHSTNPDPLPCTSLSEATSSFDAGDHLAVSPSGKFVFADSGNTITEFSVDDSTGILTANGCASETNITNPCPTAWANGANSNAADMVVSPDGNFLYFDGGAETVQWLSVDPSTGAFSDPGTGGSADCIEEVSAGTGDNCEAQMRGMRSTNTSGITGSIAISPDANGSYIYVQNGGDDGAGTTGILDVLARNLATGALTQVSGANGCIDSTGNDGEASGESPAPQACDTGPSLTDAESVIASADGQNLYVVTGYEGAESLVELHVNAATGVVSGDPVSGGSDDDCYTSVSADDPAPNCTDAYYGIDGIATAQTGEPTIGVGDNGAGVYVSGSTSQGVAVFDRTLPPQYTVAAQSGSPGADGTVAAGSSSAEASCAGGSCTVYPNATVALSATASSGYRFKAWSGGSCSGNPSPCDVSPVNAGETDIATFVQRFTVTGAVSGGSGNTVSAADGSSNAPSCSGDACTVDAGDSLTLTATAATGFRVGGWSGAGCPGTISTYLATATCTVSNVQASQAVTASFVAQDLVSGPQSVAGGTVDVAVPSSDTTSSCSGASSPQASCEVDAGSEVTVTAVPASGFSFTGWSSGTCATESPAPGLSCTITNVQANDTDAPGFVAGQAPSGNVLYLAPDGGNGNPGTEAKPLATLCAALGQIAAQPTVYSQIVMATGTYNQASSTSSSCPDAYVDLTNAENGAKIYGGYNESGSNWQPSNGGVTEIDGSPQAVLAAGATGVTLEDLTLDGSPDSGGSAYGLRAIDGAQLTLNEVQISAAHGAPAAGGTAGTTGAPGSAGGPGDNGWGGQGAPCVISPCNPSPPNSLGGGGISGAGAAGTSGTSGGCGGQGGEPGLSSQSGGPANCAQYVYTSKGVTYTQDVDYYGSSGGTSSTAGAGSGGGGGQYSGPVQLPGDAGGGIYQGANGGNGAGGNAGSGGAVGTGGTDPSSEGDTWAGGAGQAGALGAPGGGGGGGAGGSGTYCNLICFASYGDGGGGGGGPGAGGNGGTGGQAGGGSFGLYLNDASTVTVELGSSLTAGNGGAGGTGGAGGPGGAGGAGGPASTFPVQSDDVYAAFGGAGGSGGQGGPGGGGGGGVGGPSFAVYKADGNASSAPLAQDTTVTGGNSGAGGANGNGGPSGAAGQGGTTAPCGAACEFNPNLPTLPVYAIVGSGYVTVNVGCPVSAPSCTGTAVITGSSAGAAADVAGAARVTVLGKLKFKLKGHKPVALKIKLTASGKRAVKKLSSKKPLKVELSIQLKPAHKRATTYRRTLYLVKRKPSPFGTKHKAPQPKPKG